MDVPNKLTYSMLNLLLLGRMTMKNTILWVDLKDVCEAWFITMIFIYLLIKLMSSKRFANIVTLTETVMQFLTRSILSDFHDTLIVYISWSSFQGSSCNPHVSKKLYYT